MIKLIPTWGLLLIGTSLAFSLPLIYITNREAIDQGLASANQVVSAQAKQVRNIASKQTSNAASTVKSYAGDYTAKAQGLVNKTSTHTTQAPTTTTSSTIPQNSFKAQDFPVAPRKDPIIHEVAEARPMVI